MELYTPAKDVTGWASAFNSHRLFNNISYFYKVSDPHQTEIYEHLLGHFYKRYGEQQETITRLVAFLKENDTTTIRNANVSIKHMEAIARNEPPINLDNGQQVNIIATYRFNPETRIYLCDKLNLHQGKTVNDDTRTNIGKRKIYPLTTTTTLDSRLQTQTADLYAAFRPEVQDHDIKRRLEKKAYKLLKRSA